MREAVEVGAGRKSDPAHWHRARKLGAFFRRIIDINIDSAASRQFRQTHQRPSTRSGWRSPSFEWHSLSSARKWRPSRAPAGGTTFADARSEARWMVGPSAIGSEKGPGSSMMSAPASTSVHQNLTVSNGIWIAGGNERNQRLAPLQPQALRK